MNPVFKKLLKPANKLLRGLIEDKPAARAVEDYKPIKELFQKHFPVRGKNISIGQRLDQLEFDIENMLHGTDSWRKAEVLPEFSKKGINLKQLKDNIPELRKAFNGDSYVAGKAINPTEELFKAATIKTHEAKFEKKIIGDFFHKDCYPRVMQALEDQGIHLTPGQKKYIEVMYREPWKFVKMEQGYLSPGTSGYSKGANYIKLRDNVADSTIVHELHHSIRTRLSKKLLDWGYSRKQIRSFMEDPIKSKNGSRQIDQFMHPQYTDIESRYMGNAPEFTDVQKADLSPDAELGATTVETRFDLFKRMAEKGFDPNKEQMDMAIDLAGPEYLTKYWKAHGYGGWLSQNPTWEGKTQTVMHNGVKTNSIKDLMKYIGVGVPAVGAVGIAASQGS